MRETKMQEIRRKAREQTEEDVAAAYREYRKEKGLPEPEQEENTQKPAENPSHEPGSGEAAGEDTETAGEKEAGEKLEKRQEPANEAPKGDTATGRFSNAPSDF